MDEQTNNVNINDGQYVKGTLLYYGVFCTRKFNLAAVINHSGNLNSGHYTCLVKDGEMWWHCNDKAMVRVNLDDINKLLPYVLFYQAK